jgi:hypothetical protein
MSNIEREATWSMSCGTSYRIALLQWTTEDGIARMIFDELANLGHYPVYWLPGEPTPVASDVVISHGPHGRLLPVLGQIARNSSDNRPTVVHWNTEGFPDLRLRPGLMWAIGAFRSRLGRLSHSGYSWLGRLASTAPISWVGDRMHRFRYIGDYEHAYRNGWLDILADSSEVYVQLHKTRGMRAVYAPWGACSMNYADLGLERDIDVLWMGTTNRRSRLLDRVRKELEAYGVDMYVADNKENPFIFDETRTKFLNRAKITLNITRTWYDDNYSRFALAIPNRSLIVSEPLLPHCPEYQSGTHYVSAPIDTLAQTIAHYLTHDDARNAIVENAYQLLTTRLTFRNSLAKLMEVVARHRAHSNSTGYKVFAAQKPFRTLK